MSRIAYVNGRYVPHRDAAVHVEDRGYQFADGVYEVCEVFGGRLVDETRHLDRLDRSLRELRIAAPMGRKALLTIMRETVARNRVRHGLVYLQVSRGVARRDHKFPDPSTPPALVVTAKSIDPAAGERTAAAGVAVITVPETRWARPDIKSVSLLPNVLAKQQAKEAGAGEAWFVDQDGTVLEGASTNAWIVTHDGRIVTRQADNRILRGVTRTGVVDLLGRRNLTLEERPFTVEEARQAAEAFITSASSLVIPVVKIDGAAVGDGKPGPTALALRGSLHQVTEMSHVVTAPYA
ncbi:D-amino-acid transaminase [Alsobacter metallidurans]|uniref:Probable branched-chain-amino-acid aminotransferase n=1 Tax=Alsobacter metallidurans TaxID=340221 RepID=A0A917I7B5_9HYPH|nr:D-amino-acid transaminase [Alsobacter metallidurans]GGH18218.1 D-amino-acid transaminase [Alsobacter metallidurans]